MKRRSSHRSVYPFDLDHICLGTYWQAMSSQMALDLVAALNRVLATRIAVEQLQGNTAALRFLRRLAEPERAAVHTYTDGKGGRIAMESMSMSVSPGHRYQMSFSRHKFQRAVGAAVSPAQLVLASAIRQSLQLCGVPLRPPLTFDHDAEAAEEERLVLKAAEAEMAKHQQSRSRKGGHKGRRTREDKEARRIEGALGQRGGKNNNGGNGVTDSLGALEKTLRERTGHRARAAQQDARRKAEAKAKESQARDERKKKEKSGQKERKESKDNNDSRERINSTASARAAPPTYDQSSQLSSPQPKRTKKNVLKCPRCTFENQPGTVTCICGYTFPSTASQRSVRSVSTASVNNGVTNEFWRCSTCTFAENRASDRTCQVCGSARSTGKSGGGSGRASYRRTTADGSWTCPSCTFQNKASDTKCAMCGLGSNQGRNTATDSKGNVFDMTGKVKVRCASCGSKLAVAAGAEQFECGRCHVVGKTQERIIS